MSSESDLRHNPDIAGEIWQYAAVPAREKSGRRTRNEGRIGLMQADIKPGKLHTFWSVNVTMLAGNQQLLTFFLLA
ncbi:hypothetical protein ABW286_18875 [Erwinia papayae]|uniref:Transposase n=1 Tax=Erwinia papayae TaxID=206499 RepID=A0ABV3N678_9GAMM